MTSPRRTFPDEDTQPWHQQFWPWFLIVLPGSVVLAALATVYIAFLHADDLVTDDYYKTGLAINQRLEKQRAADTRGMQATVKVLEQRLQLRLAGLDNTPDLRLRLSHPMEANRDFSVDMHATSLGLYLVVLPSPVATGWHWSLDSGDEGDWRINGTLTVVDFLDDRGG